MSANATDAIPAGRRSEFTLGWKVLVAAAVGIACGASPIPFNAIGPLTKPIQAEFGWDRGQIQMSVLIFALAVTFLSPFFGGLVDRHGVRKVALFSLAGFGLSWAALALTPGNIYAFWGLWLLCGVLGGASIPLSWTRGVNSWFVKNRGFALALALMGTGVTATIMPALSAWLIAEFGWRGAIVGLSLLPLAIGLPVAWLLFREPRADERPATTLASGGDTWGVELRVAMRQPRFWLMFASFGLVALAFGGLFTNYFPLLTDKGFDPKQAGLITGVIGLSVIVGRLFAGFLIDRIWAPLVGFPMFALPAVACWLLTHDVVSVHAAVVAAVVIGFAAGAETDLIAFLSAKYFGLKHYGKIYGTLYMPFGLGSAISAPVYGAVFDNFGSYNPALWVAAVLFVAGGLLLLGIGPYPQHGAARAE